MKLSDCADKITGLITFSAWGAVATATADGAALAALAEPASGAVVLATQFALQLRASRNDVCAAAIDSIRNRTEKALLRELDGSSEFRSAIEQVFAEFDAHAAALRPTADDLVGLWRLDPEAIAQGVLSRFAPLSEAYRNNHLAKQAIDRVIVEAVTAFKDDEALHCKLEPALARQTLADLGWLRETVVRIEAMVNAMPDTVVARLLAELDRRDETKAAEQAGVQRAAILGLARRISANVEDFEQALRELKRAVEIAIEVQQEGARGSNAGDFVDAVLKRVAELSARGEYASASAEADSAFAQWEREEADRQETARQSGLKLLEAGWKQDLLAGQVPAAAAKIARASDLATPEPAQRFSALCAVQDEWYVRGRDKGLNLDLEVAIELARIALVRASDQDQRGAALNDLGLALWILGERESGTGRLEEAVAAFRAALQEHTRDRVPLDWAGTQNNLGNALARLGERESGTGRLEEAVEAFRAALQEWTRERAPLDWAMTQNNLGIALRRLGERDSGTGRLKEAVEAYRAALQERTRERVPLGWAATQNNLGNALAALGERESGTGRLEEAVKAYSAALQERTRERAPFLWAQTCENMAIAFLDWHGKTGERIGEALATVDDALEVYREAKADYDIGTAEQLRERILAASDGA